MAMERTHAKTIDEYISEQRAEVRPVLEEIRQIIREAAPEAVETIAYAIPTFDLGKKHLVHFAAFAKHIGFYPTPSAMEAFEADLAPYKRAKGSVQFPLNEPMPKDLIRRMVESRVEELSG